MKKDEESDSVMVQGFQRWGEGEDNGCLHTCWVPRKKAKKFAKKWQLIFEDVQILTLALVPDVLDAEIR